MNCPGSVSLLKALDLPTTDEPEYRSLGTSAHEAAYICGRDGLDAWEAVSIKYGHHVVDVQMAEAIQVFLDECRRIVAENPGGTEYREFGIDAPDFHPQFYGTLDWGYVVGNKMWIRDYKHGEGIAVEVEENPQIKYYAYGLLRHHDEIETIDLGIVQPRIAYLEPVRLWSTTAASLREWAEGTLKAAMNATAIDDDLDAGNWCRFCPAKLVCPLMVSLYGAAMTADPKKVVNLSNEQMGRDYQYLKAVKHYLKAFEEETFRRLNLGEEVPGTKVVFQKSNRVFKAGALELFKERLGAKAFTDPELKSPAVLEKEGPEIKKLVREWAYTPKGGMTVASIDDPRPAIKITSTIEAFPADVVEAALTAAQ
jgi:hypothetical protein